MSLVLETVNRTALQITVTAALLGTAGCDWPVGETGTDGTTGDDVSADGGVGPTSSPPTTEGETDGSSESGVGPGTSPTTITATGDTGGTGPTGSEGGGGPTTDTDSVTATGTGGEACEYPEIPNDEGFPSGALAGAEAIADELQGSCAEPMTPESAWTFTAPSEGTYTFQTTYPSGVLYVLDGCGGAERGCDSAGLESFPAPVPAAVELPLLEGETVTVAVEHEDVAPEVIGVWVYQRSMQCEEDEIDSVPSTVQSTLFNRADTHDAGCGYENNSDQGHLFTAPQDGVYTFALPEAGSNASLVALSLRDACDGDEIACEACIETVPFPYSVDCELTHAMSAGEQVAVVVDNLSSLQVSIPNPYELQITLALAL